MTVDVDILHGPDIIVIQWFTTLHCDYVLYITGSLSYAELGCIVKKSGGEYAYMYQAMGRIMAFLFAWTKVIILTPSSVAIITLTFASYVVTFFDYCGEPQVPLKVIAATAIGIFHFIVFTSNNNPNENVLNTFSS